MMIKVKTLTGKEIEVDIDGTDKIERIKERVEEKEGNNHWIREGKFWLIFFQEFLHHNNVWSSEENKWWTIKPSVNTMSMPEVFFIWF